MKGSSGFTLLELLVTVAVVAITLVWAVPSFQNLIQENRRAAAGNDLLMTLTYARTIAITRQVPVIVCKASNATTSTPSCSTTAAWENGWFAFVDNDRTGAFSTNDEILRAHEQLISGLTLRGDSTFQNQISFSSAGITSNGDFVVCDKRGWPNGARILDVKLGGRIETLTTSQQSALTNCTPT